MLYTACGTELHDPQQFCPKCGVQLRIRFSDFIVGQKSAVRRLKAIYDFCRSRAAVAEHILLVGPDGMGKLTIVRAFSGTLLAPSDIRSEEDIWQNDAVRYAANPFLRR